VLKSAGSVACYCFHVFAVQHCETVISGPKHHRDGRRFLAKEEAMLEQLFEMLAHPDEYQCCWHEGEIYLRKVCTEEAVTAYAKEREPEAA
jgi:hypothetical protein